MWHHGRVTLLERYGLSPDPVIEYYKKDVDRTLLREHLKLTPKQRQERLVAFMRDLDRLREASGRRA
jgi:hypothetical protein